MATSGNGQNGVEAALARAGEAAQSLHRTATQARAIEESATRLAAAGNEHAAATEQVRIAIESVAKAIEETATTVQSMARSQANAADTAREVQQNLTGTVAGLSQMAASIDSVRKDT